MSSYTQEHVFLYLHAQTNINTLLYWSFTKSKKWKRIIKFSYPLNFIGGFIQPEEIFNFPIRKWKPCFSRICQKVEDWLQLFSRPLFFFVYMKLSCTFLPEKVNYREKSRSPSSTFWHIREKHGFHFLMRKLRNSTERMSPQTKLIG